MKWQPIETAPRDSTLKLRWGGLWQGEIHGVSAGVGYSLFTCPADRTDHSSDEGWWYEEGGDAYVTWVKPTHWMPLPDPPVDN